MNDQGADDIYKAQMKAPRSSGRAGGECTASTVAHERLIDQSTSRITTNIQTETGTHA